MASLPTGSFKLFSLNGKAVYYTITFGGTSFYSYDGTPNGASLLLDLPGFDFVEPTGFSDKSAGGPAELGFFTVLFRDPLGATQTKIYATDGVSSAYELGAVFNGFPSVIGTGVVSSGAGSSNESFIQVESRSGTTTIVGGTSYNTAAVKATLYATDGTPGHLAALATLDYVASPFAPTADFSVLGPVGGQTLFGALSTSVGSVPSGRLPGIQDTIYEEKIYSTDGSPGGTQLLADFSYDFGEYPSQGIQVLASSTNFSILGDFGYPNLPFYVTDGTSDRTYGIPDKIAEYLLSQDLPKSIFVGNDLVLLLKTDIASSVISYNGKTGTTSTLLTGAPGDQISALTTLAGRAFYELQNASGAQLYETNADGTTLNLLSTVPVGGTFTVQSNGSGSILTSSYDAGGHLLQQETIDADGGSTTDRYAVDKTLISQTIIQGGVRQEVQYVISGKPYTGQNAFYDSANKLISMTRTYADGDPAFDQAVHADGSATVTIYTPKGDKTVSQFDAAGHLTLSQSYTGSTLTASITRPGDGSQEIVSYDPVTGQEIGFTTLNKDGSRTLGNLAVTAEPYAEQIASYDTAGHLLTLTRAYGDAAHTLAFSQTNNADGSSEVDHYDTRGRETLKIDGAVNGSRDVFTFVYADAATSPSTTVQDHYAANTKKQWTDITNPGGSHSQTAFSAGVTLTAPSAATDMFTSSSAGGDTFVFQPVVGQDVVNNFHAGIALGHDTIQLDPAVAPDFLHLQGLMNASGRDTLITVSTGDSLLIKGVALSALVAQDFTFVAHASHSA